MLGPAEESELRHAMALFQSGDLAGAERAARALRDRVPANPDVRHLLALARLYQGSAHDALELAQGLLREFPDDAFVHNTLGASLQALGRMDEAVDAYRRAVQIDASYADAAGNLGRALLATRRQGEALALSTQVLARLPRFLPMAVIGGQAALAMGRLDEARSFFARALELSPGDSGILGQLGNVHSRLGQHGESLRCFDEVLARDPRNAGAHNNRATALLALKRAADAESALRRAISLDASHAVPWHNLGCALLALGRPAEAEEAERKALAIDPRYTEATVGLCAALNRLHRGAQAQPLLRSVLARDPGNLGAAINLCTALRQDKRHDEAIAVGMDAVRRSPGNPEAHGFAAFLLSQGGRYEESLAQYDQAIRLAPHAAHWQVLRSLAMPIVADSVTQILACRDEMLRRVRALRDSGLQLEDPGRWIGQAGFYLAYHGREDVELQKATAAMYLSLHAALGWRAPSASPRGRQGRRLRVGFLSAFLHDHTIGKLYRGYVSKLDRERFEVVVLHMEPRQDAVRAAIDAAADRAIVLPAQLDEARRAVSDAALDVLFYPDVGMHNLCYFLAYARLAPVQVTSWGHPDTTGLPEIDYFLSADAIEPAGAALHYSETLVRLGRLPTHYSRPRRPARAGVRRQLGIPAGKRLYACPQSLFKFHPEFDSTLGALLDADPGGVLLLVASEHAAWNAALRERFRRAFPGHADRVHFAPFMPESVFLELLEDADAVIDPVHFGGGNSTYEALGLDVPVVTMPGPLMRGRVTLGCYRQMGLEDLVASTAQEYVALAVRLANDGGFREAMRTRIRERSGELFEDMRAVRELEDFMEGAFDAALGRAGAR